MRDSNAPGEKPSPALGGDTVAGDSSPTTPAVSSPYPRMQGQFTPPPRPPLPERDASSAANRAPIIVAAVSGVALVLLVTILVIGLAANHNGSTTPPGSVTTGATVTVAATGKTTASAAANTPTAVPTGSDTIPVQRQGTLHESSFANVAEPQGIALDANGNVYVTSLTQLMKYSPNGKVVTSVSTQAAGTLTFDSTGILWDLLPDGTLLALNTNLQLQGQYSIGTLSTGSSTAYDVNTRQNETAPFAIGSAQFGDISFFQSDAFISGIDASTLYPFVLRVHMNASDQPDAAKLITFGTEPVPLANRLPPGLAVNQNGIVATTLPVFSAITSGTTDNRLVVFSTFFPDDSTAGPPQAIWQSVLGSTGMTADASGNFYVAVGGQAYNLCGQAPGVILEVSADFSSYICYAHSSGGTSLTTQHVAVNASGDIFDTAIDPAGDSAANVSKDGVFVWTTH